MKLFTLGCSLTDQLGVKEKLSSLIDADLVNLSQGAGSNQLQINRLHESFIRNDISANDIIYWQITSPYRHYARLRMNMFEEVDRIQKEKFVVANGHYGHYVNNSKNVFDDLLRIDLLCNSPLINSVPINDPNQELQTLLANIIMTSKIVPKTLIVFGWTDMMSKKQFSIFKKFLTLHNINFVDTPYLEYVVNNQLGMQDDLHPTESAGRIFAEQVVYKKLIELQWI